MGGKIALVLGASGLTGKHCLKILLDSKDYSKVIILVRSSLNLDHPKLQQAIVDFDYTAAMEQYYIGVDDVFCCLCTDVKNAGSPAIFRRIDFHIPTEAANIASEHGVKQFLAISTRGADNRSSDLYRRVKGEMEKGLQQFSFEALHVFRPAVVRIENNIKDNQNGFLKRFFSPDYNISATDKTPISAGMLAQAMVNTALAGNAGMHYYGSSQIIKISENKNSTAVDMDLPQSKPGA